MSHKYYSRSIVIVIVNSESQFSVTVVVAKYCWAQFERSPSFRRFKFSKSHFSANRSFEHSNFRSIVFARAEAFQETEATEESGVLANRPFRWISDFKHSNFRWIENLKHSLDSDYYWWLRCDEQRSMFHPSFREIFPYKDLIFQRSPF